MDINEQKKKDDEYLSTVPEPHRAETRHSLVLLRAFQNKDKEAFIQEMNDYKPS